MTIVTSTANAGIKAARRLARRRGRDEGDRFLVEGPAVDEAYDILERLYVTGDAHAAVASRAAAAGVEVVVVDEAVMSALSDTVTAQGVVGVARSARPSLVGLFDQLPTGRVLVADGVADPGNAGTLVRTADAAGFDGVVFTTGSVDPRHPKVVRASVGSLFHLPVVDRVEAADLVTACATSGLRLIGADARAATTSDACDLRTRVALVVGNERHGLSPLLDAALDVRVAIPMHTAPRPGYTGAAESLNLAVSAAVLMLESARQRRAAGDGAGA